MNKKILEWPNSILRKKASPIDLQDASSKKVIEDLLDTFRVVQGYGLAAPQIGYSKRALVVSPMALGMSSGEEQLLMINPVIKTFGDIVRSQEACFSVPEISVTVKRSSKCEVSFLDAGGTSHKLELEGLPAFCVQHEVDHLDGKVTLDKVSQMARHHHLKRRKKQREARLKIERELRQEFENDHDIYANGAEGRPKRKSKLSKDKKRAQRLARKLNYKSKKKRRK
tara:strand:- start:645 stop:1322 length:678 start_codon:yes stop_codon:yes gene_type:complete